MTAAVIYTASASIALHLISQDPLLYISLHIFQKDNKKLSSLMYLVDYF